MTERRSEPVPAAGSAPAGSAPVGSAPIGSDPSGSDPGDGTAPEGQSTPKRRPFYERTLRLRHLRLRPWQRVALADGSVVLAVVLVLADLVSPWALLVLPLSVAGFVKLHDVVAGLYAPRDGASGGD